MWEAEFINLGEIKQNKRQSFLYKYKKELPKIEEIDAGCSCTKATIKGNNIAVTYTPNPIPVHLSSQGYYIADKTITVWYESGNYDILEFKAKVVK